MTSATAEGFDFRLTRQERARGGGAECVGCHASTKVHGVGELLVGTVLEAVCAAGPVDRLKSA